MAIALEGISTPYSEKLGREMGYKSDRFRPLDSYQWADEILDKITKEIEEESLIEL